MDVMSYGLSKKYTDKRISEVTGLELNDVNATIEGKADKAEVEQLSSELAQTVKKEELDAFQKVNTEFKHRALVFPPPSPQYSFNAIEQLNSNGFGVEVTNLVMFAQNVDEFMEEFDIFVFTSTGTTLPYLSPVTPQDVVDSLTKWKNKGKRIIYYTLSNTHTIRSLGANGETISTVPLNTILPVTISGVVFDSNGTGEFQQISPYFSEDTVVYSGFKPRGSARHLVSSGSEVIVRAVEGSITADVAIMQKDQFVVIGLGGNSGGAELAPNYRYLDVGVIAKRLIGDFSNASLAFDCMFNKRIAAFGIDADITNEIQANEPYIDVFKPVTLEIGLVTEHLDENIASWYRKQTGRIEYNSHTATHQVRVNVVDEVHTIPTNQVVTLNFPYRVESSNLVYVKTVDDTLTFTLKEGGWAISKTSGQYTHNDMGQLLFHESDVGKQIKITYQHVDDPREWLGSLDELKQYQLITNDSIYLTGGYHSLNHNTLAYALRKGIALCDHTSINRRSESLLRGNLVPKFVPLFSPTLDLGDGLEGFDNAVYNVTKNDAKTINFPKMQERVRKLNKPYVWYSHDFIFSETDERSLHGGTRYHADWGKPTYEESVEYAKEMLRWIIEELNSEGVYWTYRSDYSRWYNELSQNIVYSVSSADGATFVTVENRGERKLKGLTFREKREVQPTSVKVLSDKNIPYVYVDGEVRFAVDLTPSEAVTVKIS